MIKRLHPVLALTCALALGCTPAGGVAPTTPGGGEGSVKAGGPGGSRGTPAASPAIAGGAITPTPPPLAPGVGVVSNNGATFVGKVRAPAGIVSNNGGAIISDNGAGIISDNGAGFVGKVRRQLLAVDQVPVAGATVRVTDARGATLTGPDGKPLTAVTGPDGGYAFPGLKPAQNLLVVADLPAGNGQVQAVALRGTDGAVDLDLISTLTTAYIHASWVATQADPNATFERLTPDAERAARDTAAAALGKAGSVVLPTFAVADVKTAVEALRKADAAFDAQLEVVRKLLLVAGLEDQGAGTDARTKVLGFVEAVLPLPDGSLAIAARDDNRVWRVGPDGMLQPLVGSGRAVPADGGGMAALDFGLETPQELALDPQGRLLILDNRRVVRLEADGKVSVRPLARFGFQQAVLAGRGADEVYVLQESRALETFTGPDLQAGPVLQDAASPPPGMKTDLGAVPLGPDAEEDDEAYDVDFEPTAGHAPDGKVHVLQWASYKGDYGYPPPAVAIAYTYDPATGARAAAPPVEGRRVALGPDATWFSIADDGALVATPAAGAPVRYPAAALEKLPDALQAEIDPAGDYPTPNALRFGPGGKTYVHEGYRVYELSPDGGVRHVAGVDPAGDRTGQAADLDIDDPTSVAAAGTAIYYIESEVRHVMRRDAAGAITTFAGTGEASTWGFSTTADGRIYVEDEATGAETDFGLAYTAKPGAGGFNAPYGLRPYLDGLMLIDSKRMARRIHADGAISTLFVAAPAQVLIDALPAADDGFWLLRGPKPKGFEAKPLDLVRRHADGREEVVTQLQEDRGNLALGLDGTLWVRAGEGLWRWNGTALAAVVRDKRLDVGAYYDDQPTRLAGDRQGRAYFAGESNVLRWSAAGGLEILAGPGGKLRAGKGAAGGLGAPTALAFEADGSLLIADEAFDTILRLPAEQLK